MNHVGQANYVNLPTTSAPRWTPEDLEAVNRDFKIRDIDGRRTAWLVKKSQFPENP
jgi:hypothetical protein